MITIEQKIEQFRRMVLGHAKHALEEKVAQLDQNDLLAMEQMKKELESLGSKHIDEHVQLALIERKRLLAKAKLQKTHALLKVKDDFVQGIRTELESQAKALTTQPHYLSSLIEDLRRCTEALSPEDDLRVYLESDDLKWSADIEKALSRFSRLTIMASIEPLIGGAVVESVTLGQRYDMSYKSKIAYSDALNGGRVFEILSGEA